MSRAVRTGLITSAANMAPEPSRFADSDCDTVLFKRIAVSDPVAEAASGSGFGAIAAAARSLAEAGMDVVAWAGIPGPWLGWEREEALRAGMSAAAARPATTSALALLAACRAYGVRRLGVVGPDDAEVSAGISDMFGGKGIEVRYRPSDGGVDAAVEADAVALLGTGTGALAERSPGIPVIDPIAATVWHAAGLVRDDFSRNGFGDLLANGSLRSRMQAVAEGLRAETAADRTTLRIDLPEAGCSVATCAAESCAAGVRSIRRDATLPQRDLETVRWLERHRTLLVQPDFSAPPHPPQALREVYGVGAQMLAPIVGDGVMVAWLSVHSLTERPWSHADRAAATAAADRIGTLVAQRRAVGWS
jgi:maleate isomerase